MLLADGVGVRPRSAAAEVLADHNAHVGAIERAIDARTTGRELRRKWILAARASGAARARGSEGALLAAADLRAVARRLYSRERELGQCRHARDFGDPVTCTEPKGHAGPHRAGAAWWQVDTCAHCGTPHDFAGELCRECGKRPFVEVLDEDDGGHD